MGFKGWIILNSNMVFLLVRLIPVNELSHLDRKSTVFCLPHLSEVYNILGIGMAHLI